MNNYDDIINIKHFEPKFHKRMSVYSRSAQFAPFSALTGYEDSIDEMGRITEEKRILDDNKIESLSLKLDMIIKNKIKKVKITYFVRDLKKSGGKYLSKYVNIKKIDNLNKELYLENNERIKLSDLLDISIIN